ncbi:hypothetical protein LPJ73_009019 [Coemansia sp. RSA 2703]|nr:hypothetical protein LPJ73_009019 [Coemansia sp. RSA 2703]
MIKAPPQPYLRLKIFVFLAVVSAVAIIGTYMFASYIDTVSQNHNYLTLGFDHIYILSRRADEERRRVMAKQMQFQGIMFGFHPLLSSYDIDHPEDYKHFVGEDNWPTVPVNHTLSSEDLAIFRSHMNVIDDILRLEFRSALVLSDRIDMEVDIKQKMRSVIDKLPESWEVLYLGHCSEPELQRPSRVQHESVFIAYKPRCLYSYAVSRQGALRLKRILDNIWPNPKYPFKQQMVELVHPMYLEAYVIEPPLITEVRHNDHTLPQNQTQQHRALKKSTLNKMGVLP